MLIKLHCLSVCTVFVKQMWFYFFDRKYNSWIIFVYLFLCMDFSAKIVVCNCINLLQTVKNSFERIVKVESSRLVEYDNIKSEFAVYSSIPIDNTL